MNVFVFFFSWTSIFSKTEIPGVHRGHAICVFFQLLFASLCVQRAHPPFTLHPHTPRSTRPDPQHVPWNLIFTNIHKHKFNYYQLFNTIVVSLYKMQFRPKITTKYEKMFLTKWLVQTFKNTIWSPNFPIGTNRQFPITNIHKNHLVFNKHPQTYSCFPYKMWISNT